MIDKIASAVVVVVAIITAAVVDHYGGDSAPYLSLATLGLGYGVGHTVGSTKSKK